MENMDKPCGLPPFTLSEAHIALRDNVRKVMNRFDPLGYFEAKKLSFADFIRYIFDLLDRGGHNISTILWDIMYSGDFYSLYESEINPLRKNADFERWRREGVDLFGELVRESKKRGYESFIVNRVSEVDIDIIDNPIAVKYAHPDQFIKAWEDCGLNNLASKEVRARKYALFTELLTKYDFDGLDIDFMRHTPFLTPGRQWELRENITEYMRGVRKLTQEIAAKRGRPVLLSARVPDTLENCHDDGIDIEAFARENLVDILTVGARSLEADIKGFREVVGSIKLFASYDGHHCSDGYAYAPIEVMRGVFCNWWHQGVDGVQIFNWITAGNALRAETKLKTGITDFGIDGGYEQAFFEMGDYERMKPLNKTFIVERRGGYPWGEGESYNNQRKQLPAALHNFGGDSHINMYVSDDLKANRIQIASLRLTLVIHGLNDQDTVRAKLNQEPLDDPIYDREWNETQVWAPDAAPDSGNNIGRIIYENRKPHHGRKLLRVTYDIRASAVATGNNTISVSVVRMPHGKNANSIKLLPKPTLEKAEISVEYHTTPR